MATNQSQRVCRFSCIGGFLCWAECCSLDIRVKDGKWLSSVWTRNNYLRRSFLNSSSVNLCSVVLNRYMAVVKPFSTWLWWKDAASFKWFSSLVFYPSFLLWQSTTVWFIYNLSLTCVIFFSQTVILFKLYLCFLLTFCYISMLGVFYKHNQAARKLVNQLHFNHRCSVKIPEKSALKLMATVI